MTAALNIRRGRLSDDEKATIEAMAEQDPPLGPHPIARALNRHHATINWHMLSYGLITRQPRHLARSYVRHGQIVHPWEPAHDVRLTALLLEHERPQSCRVRATILAAAEDAP